MKTMQWGKWFVVMAPVMLVAVPGCGSEDACRSRLSPESSQHRPGDLGSPPNLDCDKEIIGDDTSEGPSELADPDDAPSLEPQIQISPCLACPRCCDGRTD